MAAAIIASADRAPAPGRLILGSDACRYAGAALRERLDALEEDCGASCSADAMNYPAIGRRALPEDRVARIWLRAGSQDAGGAGMAFFARDELPSPPADSAGS
jgi:hypothetical protein